MPAEPRGQGLRTRWATDILHRWGLEVSSGRPHRVVKVASCASRAPGRLRCCRKRLSRSGGLGEERAAHYGPLPREGGGLLGVGGWKREAEHDGRPWFAKANEAMV